MNTQIAITLPEQVYAQAERLARMTSRDVSDLIADTITLYFAPVGAMGEGIIPVSELSDDAVLALARLQLPPAQDRRMSRLLRRQQAGKLGDEERAELTALMQAYQEGLLRKAQALNEAVRRGLRGPLEP